MLLTSVVVSELQDGSAGRVSTRRKGRRTTSASGAQGTGGRRVRGRASERVGRKAACGDEPQKVAET